MRSMIVLLIVMFFAASIASAQDEPPNFPLAKHIRAVHFVLRAVPYESAIRIVDMASKSGMNTIVVQLTDGVRLEHAPWTARRDAWSKKKLLKWVIYAKSKSISVVPELKLLTHQGNFFQNNFPYLMYNKKTYDPKKIEVYKRIFPLIDEVIALLQPQAIHIGHDEVNGCHKNWKQKVKDLFNANEMLPANLFYKDVMRLHQYLQNKKVITWIWGDMLLSPNEFHELKHKWSFYNGRAEGYGLNIRRKLPKDIVICDWQYWAVNSAVPSFALFRNEGFRVIGSTWKNEKTIKNFSHYAGEHDAYGMMATTWFHVQRKEWDVVDRIISFSGKTFLKDFPNEK